MYSARGLLVFVVYWPAAFAEEGHEPQPEHIKGGQTGGDPADQPEDPASVRLIGECLPENFVFGEEAAEGREAGDGERGDRHRPKGPGNQLAQASHVAHILLSSETVNHRASSEKE